MTISPARACAGAARRADRCAAAWSGVQPAGRLRLCRLGPRRLVSRFRRNLPGARRSRPGPRPPPRRSARCAPSAWNYRCAIGQASEDDWPAHTRAWGVCWPTWRPRLSGTRSAPSQRAHPGCPRKPGPAGRAASSPDLAEVAAGAGDLGAAAVPARQPEAVLRLRVRGAGREPGNQQRSGPTANR